MGEFSNIEWCDGTWNPWRGCRITSPGCWGCYVYRDMPRFGLDPTSITRSKTTFRQPLRWKKPHLIFTCSWSDYFIEEADEWRDEAWAIIRNTPQHTYQVLTKRPHRIKGHLPADWPMANVWLGVTVENKEHGLPRMDILREIPASVRFISAEPLLEDLGPINLTGFNWVIAGGESGRKARRMKPEWPSNIRDQCIAAGVPFFFKQWGEFNEYGSRVGKKKSSRLFEGREWNHLPAVDRG